MEQNNLVQPNQFFSLEQVIDRQPITVSMDTPLNQVISLMQEWGTSCSFIDGEKAVVSDMDIGSNNSCVLVVEKNRLRGIFTERDLVKLVATGGDTQNVTVGEIMTQEVVTLTPAGDQDIFTALSLLKNHGIRHLPVVSDRQNVIGLITAKNLRQKLQPLDLMKWRTVSEVMETGVVYAAAEDSVQSIAILMADHNISCVAIAELEADPQTNSSWVRPIGIITERDIVQFQNLSLDLALPARNLMSAPLFLVSPEDSLWDVNQQMQQRRIRRFLVANERGELQGIITQSTLLQLFDPAELYGSLEILQRQVCQLETERERLLQQSNSKLEQEVQKSTAVIATQNQQLQQRIRQQQAVAELGKFAISAPTLEAILDRAVNLVTNILEVEYCKVLELLPDDTLFLKAGVGWQDGLVGVVTLGIDEGCQARYALQQSQPVIVNDLRTETRFDAPSLLINHQVISGMSVIILDGAKPFGVIGIHTRQHRIFTQDDINFLCAIANIIAQANERQQVASALQEREKLFRVLVTSAPVGIFQTNAQGDCLYVNQRWQEMTGLTTQEALGQGWFEALYPGDRDLIFAECSEATQTAREFNLEYRFIAPQGKITWVEGKVVPLYGETGEISGYLGTVIDISDRKQAEVVIDADLRDTQILLDLSARLLSEADTQVLYHEIVATAIALMQSDGGSLQILDEATQELVATAHQGFDQTMVERFYRVPASSNTSCGIALATNARTFIDFDVPPSADPDGVLRMHVNAGYLSGQSTPLMTCLGKPIGMLSTHWHNQHRPSDRELRYLDLLARQAADLIEQRQVETNLAKSNQILQAISSIQTQYLSDAEPQIVFDGMLAHLLELTQSEYGFIGEIHFTADGSPMMETGYLKVRGRPYLKTHAITNIAWNDETRAFYAENAPNGMEFHNLETLFGAVIVTGEPVIANSPSTDPRRGGTPAGHPDLNAFLGVPFYKNDQMTGMVGIANKEGGYDEGIVKYLQPLLDTCSRLIEAYKSERQKQQADLKIHQQAALLNVATDAIMVRELDDKILFWNQGAEKLYGWTKQETLNKQANEFFYRKSEATKAKLDDIHQKIREKGKWQGELTQITKAGQKIIVESRWTLVKDAADNPQSYLVVNTDITEQKQLEAQFLRTQRLESLGTLAGGIAHDLNNILAPILGFSKLLPLKLPGVDEQTKGFFKIMENNANRGSALVKQILTFSRGLEGERGIVQIRHLIAEVGQIINETFPKSIELVTNVPKNLWAVNADVNQLHQILINLAVNAKDAMPNGGILTISAENTTVDADYARLHIDAQEGAYVLITVTDTGMGISPEVIDRIFEPFFTTKEIGRGTGLGLSTVIGIINSHGGFVDVVSDQERRGTQFKVFLPAADPVARNPEEAAEILQGHGELILVVDDETAILEVTQATLETYNYRVLTASNGIEAIATYAQNQGKISLAIMDIMMPTMDGKTAILALKQLNPELKVMAVSGLINRQEIIAELADNVTAFMNKPYGNDDLLRMISEILHSART
jgi:PAS domain S-box-containing protein